MHLHDVYRRDLGLARKRVKPKAYLEPHYFPRPFEKYITVHNDNKVPAKSYRYWTQVISLIKNKAPELKIVQIGSGSEGDIEGVDLRINTDSLKQCAFIIKHSSAHIGIDSVPSHLSSHFNTPCVALYAHTYPNTCKPIWGECRIVESKRNGKKPSFSLEDPDQTIDMIKPEEVANELLDLLGYESAGIETLYIGQNCSMVCHDILPFKPVTTDYSSTNFRLDFVKGVTDDHLKNLATVLNKGQSEVTISEPIPDEFIDSKRISVLNYKTDEFDGEFLAKIASSGIQHSLLCTDPKKLHSQRLKFFDKTILLFDEKEIIKSNRKIAKNKKINHSVMVESSKRIVDGDRVYDSFFDYGGRKNLDDLFFEIGWLWVYTQSNGDKTKRRRKTDSVPIVES